MNELKASSCAGKSGFATWALAHKRLKRMLRRGERGLTMYRCRICRLWHIGSKNAGDRRV